MELPHAHPRWYGPQVPTAQAQARRTFISHRRPHVHFWGGLDRELEASATLTKAIALLIFISEDLYKSISLAISGWIVSLAFISVTSPTTLVRNKVH